MDAGESIHSNGMFERKCIQPAAAAWPARRRAVFMPTFTDSVATLIEELCWECSRTNTRCVRFDNTENLRNRRWWDTCADGGSTRNRMATCHKWVRTAIEIEHRRLGTLKQDLTAGIHQVVRQRLRVTDIRCKCFGYSAKLLDDGIHRVCLALEDVLQDGIF